MLKFIQTNKCCFEILFYLVSTVLHKSGRDDHNFKDDNFFKRLVTLDNIALFLFFTLPNRRLLEKKMRTEKKIRIKMLMSTLSLEE